jgi:hypothetical protein
MLGYSDSTVTFINTKCSHFVFFFIFVNIVLINVAYFPQILFKNLTFSATQIVPNTQFARPPCRCS